MNAALLLTALFNGAWQGALLCTAAVFAFRFFRRLNATTMFTVWSVLLAIAVLLPAANYVFAARPVSVNASVDGPRYLGRGSIPHHDTISATVTQVRAARVPSTVPATVPAVAPPPLRDSALRALKNVLHYANWILLGLAAIAFLRLAVLGRDIVRMLVARSRVRPIAAPVTLGSEIARPYAFAASDEFTSPCVLGFVPALIVIPEALLEQSGSELTSVVLHEREHVRRFDDIQNVAQRIIGAIAFFCPGVRIALRELALYREQICDDAAVSATGDRVSYAMTLTDLAQWAQGRGAPVPSLIFKRKHLLHRLEVLLDSAVNHSLRMNRRFALAAATAVVVASIAVLHFQVPVIAETMNGKGAGPRYLGRASIPQHDTQAMRARIRAMKQNVAALKRNAVALKRNAVALKHNAVALKHNAVALKHNVVAIKRDVVELKHETATLHRNVHAMQRELRPMRVHRHAHTHMRAPIASEMPYAPKVTAVAAVGVAAVAPAAPLVAQAAPHDPSGSLLDALNNAGMHNLSVDQLIALRDHGVTGALIQAATSYFGRVSAADLTYLADHGVGTNYIDTLRNGGISGIRPSDAAYLMDHGVSAPLIHSALEYFDQRPGPGDLAFMADHGLTSTYIDGLRRSGVHACWEDAVQMLDHGVDGAYVQKIRRQFPNATIPQIIRLRDNGF